LGLGLAAYQTSQEDFASEFALAASRSLITPRLVLMMEIPRPPRIGLSLVAPLVDAPARSADPADMADDALAVGGRISGKDEGGWPAGTRLLPSPKCSLHV